MTPFDYLTPSQAISGFFGFGLVVELPNEQMKFAAMFLTASWFLYMHIREFIRVRPKILNISLANVSKFLKGVLISLVGWGLIIAVNYSYVMYWLLLTDKEPAPMGFSYFACTFLGLLFIFRQSKIRTLVDGGVQIFLNRFKKK